VDHFSSFDRNGEWTPTLYRPTCKTLLSTIGCTPENHSYCTLLRQSSLKHGICESADVAPTMPKTIFLQHNVFCCHSSSEEHPMKAINPNAILFILTHLKETLEDEYRPSKSRGGRGLGASLRPFRCYYLGPTRRSINLKPRS
jgi:hypothetical protein